MSYVIQSCNIREIGQEAESTPKIEFPSCISYLVATYHGKKSSFSYGELNVVLASQLSCRHIKLLQMNSKLLPTNQISYSSFRFVASGFTRWICSVYLYSSFCYGSDNFCFSTSNSPLFLSFWSSLF